MSSENVRKLRTQNQVIQEIDSNKTGNVQLGVTMRRVRGDIVAVEKQ
jgi:hypothetical protein